MELFLLQNERGRIKKKWCFLCLYKPYKKMRKRVCNVSTVRASSETNEVSLDFIWHNQAMKPILLSSVNLFSNKLWRGNSVCIYSEMKFCYVMSKCSHAHRIVCCFVLFQELLIQFFRDGHRMMMSLWSYWGGDAGFSWSPRQWKVTKPVKTVWSLSLRIHLVYLLMKMQTTAPK